MAFPVSASIRGWRPVARLPALPAPSWAQLGLVVASSAATAGVVLGLQILSISAFPRDSVKRIHELQAGQRALYAQLAHKDALLESQRRIYVERLRRIERFLLAKEQELVRLQTRLSELRQEAATIAVE